MGSPGTRWHRRAWWRSWRRPPVREAACVGYGSSGSHQCAGWMANRGLEARPPPTGYAKPGRRVDAEAWRGGQGDAMPAPCCAAADDTGPGRNRIPMFKKLLIANRGEIACRIIRSCRKLGIATVAVYSEADADALHVQLADEKFLLGPPAAARELSAGRPDHRGLPKHRCRGRPSRLRLSVRERAAFAKALEEAGIVFVGPPAGAIEAMGDKIASEAAGPAGGSRPCPGHLDAVADPAEALRDRARDRLPGDGQGLGRRRRQGHAHRP